MHAVAEAQGIMFSVPRGPFEKMGDYIRRSGGVFGLTPSQAKKIAYNEVKDLRASRLDAMRAIAQQLKQDAVKRRELINDTQQRLEDLAYRGGGAFGSNREGTKSTGRGGDATLAGGDIPSRGITVVRPTGR